MNELDANEVFDRAKASINVKRDADLWTDIGVPPSTGWNWRKRNSIPTRRLVEFARRHDLNIHYLLLGEGPVRRAATPPIALAPSPPRSPSPMDRDNPEQRHLVSCWQQASHNDQPDAWLAVSYELRGAAELSRRRGEATLAADLDSASEQAEARWAAARSAVAGRVLNFFCGDDH